MAGQVVGIELFHVYRDRPRVAHRGHFGGEPIGGSRRQHDRRPRGELSRQFDADLTSPAENHHRAVHRVVHG
nr:hypothetical protein CPGR_05270 [Mycolicibacter nonchromogenicus]